MGDRKKIVVKHEGRVVEEFQARGFDFDADPAYVVTGRRVQIPTVLIGDRLYVDARVGGEVVAIVPSKLDQCWNLYFSPTAAFRRSLQRSHRRVRKAEAEGVGEEVEAGAGEEADDGDD